MPENFYLDPDGLQSATNGMRDSGREITAAFGKLSATLDAHRNCWGTDDIGKAFAEKYVPSETTMLADGKIGAQNFTDIADIADEWSDTFQSVDRNNAKRIDGDFTPS